MILIVRREFRCEALYSKDYLRTLKGTAKEKEIQCTCIAEYIVDCEKLCRVHAGMKLIKSAEKIS